MQFFTALILSSCFSEPANPAPPTDTGASQSKAVPGPTDPSPPAAASPSPGESAAAAPEGPAEEGPESSAGESTTASTDTDSTKKKRPRKVIRLENTARETLPDRPPPTSRPDLPRQPDRQTTRNTRAGTRGGQGVSDPGKWGMDFQGFLRAPMRIGFGEREDPQPGQGDVTLHSPQIPDDQYLSWQHTQHNPRAWAELYLGYGNDVAKGTIGIQAFNFTDAGFKENAAQFGIAQGYVTITPKLRTSGLRVRTKVGAFDNRYGMAGMYDAGEYDTYLFGRTHMLGQSIEVGYRFGDFDVWAEEGFGATRPNPSTFNTGRFTFTAHSHAGFGWKDFIEVTGHWLGSFAREEDREGALDVDVPDGSLMVAGGDVRINAKRFGYYYAGYSWVGAEAARSVGPALEVIHSKGGGEFNIGIVSNYLDGPTGASNGNGTVHTGLFQLEHTVQRAMGNFSGRGMDFGLKLYTMVNRVRSDDPDIDGITKFKYGVDGTYSALAWLAGAIRYDRIQPNNRIPEQSFSILSARVLFRTNWVTHEEISVQYSRYIYNIRECPTGSDPALCVQPPAAPVLPDGFGATSGGQDPNTRGAPLTLPDENVFTIQARIWW